MENQLEFILKHAKLGASYEADNESELKEILAKNGGEHFWRSGDILFTTNKHGIIEGIGFDCNGNFKIWNNTKFGFINDGLMDRLDKLDEKFQATKNVKNNDPK